MKLSRKRLVLLFIILSIAGISQAQIKAGESAPELIIKDWIKNVPDDKKLTIKGEKNGARSLRALYVFFMSMKFLEGIRRNTSILFY